MAAPRKNQYGEKARVKILTVDPPTRRIEAALKDGGLIQVSVWEVPVAFRWPREGETWIVRKDTGFWVLDKPDAGPEIEEMEPGDIRLSTSDGDAWVDDKRIITEANADDITFSENSFFMTSDLAKSHPGSLFFATNIGSLYRSNGTSWVQIAAKVPETPVWSNFTYSNNWSVYQFANPTAYSPGFWKDRTTNVVYLRGLVQRFTSTWTTTEVIATLPVGYRPQQRLLFSANMSGTALGMARIDVSDTGAIHWGGVYTDPTNAWASTNWVSLDNIRFPTA